MPPATDLTALTAAITTGFAEVTKAIKDGQAVVDLAPLVSQVERVADALSTPAVVGLPNQPNVPAMSIAQIAAAANAQVKTVIGDYSDGNRVKVFSEKPA